MVVRLRAPVKVWKEKDDNVDQYSFSQPIIEEPERLIALFYNIARGHALLNKRSRTTQPLGKPASLLQLFWFVCLVKHDLWQYYKIV